MQITEIFPWNVNFETGVPLIDAQHKKLVHLINKLAGHLSKRSDATTLNAVFDELANYAVYHFQSEEAIWQEFLAEDAWELEHKQTHGSFVAEVLNLKAEEGQKSLDEVVEDILKFLTHWLVFHILESDMRMAKAVLTVQSGTPLQQAKENANQEMNGAMKALIESILSMYDGITTQTLALMKEVVARQKVEAKLRLAGKAIESTLDAVCITDADFTIIEVNPSFCEKTEWSLDEVLGKNLNEFKSGLNEERPAAIWEALLQQSHWVGEISSQTKSGALKIELLTLSAVKNTEGLISNYVGIFSDINHLLKKQQKLEKLANHDKLTGLPNRMLLADRLEVSIAHADRNRDYLAVCYLDLDGFKQVNDRFGHQAGDVVLQEISRRLLNVIRNEDTVARLGGDEFVILLGNLDSPEDYKSLLDRVLIEVKQPIPIGGDIAIVGVSIGVTIYPEDNTDADTLMQHADKAMYHAKESGKSAYYLYRHETAF